MKYCLETLYLGSGHESLKLRVPMVSFCDIPLSEIKNHIDSYGTYGIGLTKEWAERKKLNPVLYIEKSSHLAGSYWTAVGNHIVNDVNKDTVSNGAKALTDVMRYFKHYQGPLERKGTIIDQYRFSDEREWRYVPPYDCVCKMMTDEDDYQDRKAEIDSGIEPLRLEFEPSDIKYIIIDNDEEIREFMSTVRDAKGKFSLEDFERLTTRIITTEQIMTDF